MVLTPEELNQRIDRAHRAWCQACSAVSTLEEAQLWLSRAREEAVMSRDKARAALDLISGDATAVIVSTR